MDVGNLVMLHQVPIDDIYICMSNKVCNLEKDTKEILDETRNRVSYDRLYIYVYIYIDCLQTYIYNIYIHTRHYTIIEICIYIFINIHLIPMSFGGCCFPKSGFISMKYDPLLHRT